MAAPGAHSGQGARGACDRVSLAAAAFSLAAAAAAASCAAAENSSAPWTDRDANALTRAAERHREHRSLAVARRLLQLVAAAAASVALGLGRHGPAAALAGVLAISLLIAALTEVGPRWAAPLAGSRVTAGLRAVAGATRKAMYPIVALGSQFESILLARFPAPTPDAAMRELSQERFREVVSGGHDVSRREQALLHGVFSLGETSVRDVMVPRVDVIGIDHDTPWSEVLDRVRSSEHARFPVYAETIDDVTGILHAKDLLPAVIADEEPPGGWLSLVRPPQFIPGTNSLGEQLRDFKASRAHLAIVVDEYGGTAGLITIEDVLEEIVGDINDEYDIDDPEVEQEGRDRFWVSARLTLDELSSLLGQTFEDEAVTTVGGLIYERLGRVPVAGERLTIDGFRVVVEQVVRRRVRRVYFERLPPADPAQP